LTLTGGVSFGYMKHNGDKGFSEVEKEIWENNMDI
jgi:hypothetical protein